MINKIQSTYSENMNNNVEIKNSTTSVNQRTLLSTKTAHTNCLGVH